LAAAILPNRVFNTNYMLTMAVGCSELLIFDDPGVRNLVIRW
jgi:hypothetical protein